MTMRFLNMADFLVAMLCRAHRITHMWRGYPLVMLCGTGGRMAGDKTVYSSSRVCPLCSVFHLSWEPCSSRGEARCACPGRVGWLRAGSATWSCFPPALHRASASASIIFRVSCATSACLTCRIATMSTQCRVIVKFMYLLCLSARSTWAVKKGMACSGNMWLWL